MKTLKPSFLHSDGLLRASQKVACTVLIALFLSLAMTSQAGAARGGAAGQATTGPPALGMSISVYHNQQHFAYLDGSGDIEDAFFDGNTWHLQRINNGGATRGPAAAGNPFVSVYQNQQHFAYLDGAGNLVDAFFDGNNNSWHLQRLNDGGATNGPPAAGNLFVSVYNNQQHFAYLDRSGNIQDAFFDGSKWHLQRINNGGATGGPAAAGNLFVSVYASATGLPSPVGSPQQHFTYLDRSGNIQDAFFDGSKWHLQRINNRGATGGPAAAGNLFVSLFQPIPFSPPQQHFSYLDKSGNILDAFFDGKTWHLQKINAGGNTRGAAADGNLFVSVYGNQQHFAYSDAAGNLIDAFYDQNGNSWNLQQINDGGNTRGNPVAGQVFVSVYQNQQHFAYLDYREVLQDAFFDGNSRSWQLQQLTRQLPTVSASAPLDAVVIAVLYAPPGSSTPNATKSSASYGSTSTLGTSSAVSKSFKQGYQISVEAGALGQSVSAQYGSSIDKTDSSEIDTSKSTGTTVQVSGPAQDGIDHNQDQIVLLLNPVMELNVTGKNVAWTLSHSGTHGPLFLPVTIAWLKSPSSMPRDVATALQNSGISQADYPKLMAHDPFANGATYIDPARFESTDTTLPYDIASDSFGYKLENDLTNKSSHSTTKEDEFSVTIKAGFKNPVVTASLSNTDSFQWSNTSTYGTTTESQQQATATVIGPSSAWQQGSIIDVYYDRIYSTFLFAFDPISVPQVRDRNASLKGTVTSAGRPAAHQEILVSVGGQTFRTYTDARGAYYFYRLPLGQAVFSIRGAREPIRIGTTTLIHNRELLAGVGKLKPLKIQN